MYWESILRDMIGYRVKLKSFSPVSYQPVPLFGMNNVINFLECFLNIKKMYFLLSFHWKYPYNNNHQKKKGQH